MASLKLCLFILVVYLAVCISAKPKRESDGPTTANPYDDNEDDDVPGNKDSSDHKNKKPDVTENYTIPQQSTSTLPSISGRLLASLAINGDVLKTGESN